MFSSSDFPLPEKRGVTWWKHLPSYHCHILILASKWAGRAPAFMSGLGGEKVPITTTGLIRMFQQISFFSDCQFPQKFSSQFIFKTLDRKVGRKSAVNHPCAIHLGPTVADMHCMYSLLLSLCLSKHTRALHTHRNVEFFGWTIWQ